MTTNIKRSNEIPLNPVLLSFHSFSQHGSTHNLNNNYCDTSDNWTDHDMDIYMARNSTARNNGMGPI